jgi:hypothetical protein|tara:strand:- start:518 stop:619 length:102 start_codon:yes stop_codon:yes gene_type:complete
LDEEQPDQQAAVHLKMFRLMNQYLEETTFPHLV